MEVKLNIRNIDLRNTQEKVEDNVKQLRKVGRKAVLAYAGLWGLAYDEAKAILERGKKLVDEAENRGEKIEETAASEAKKARKDAEKRVKKLQKRLESRIRRTESKTEKQLERQVQDVLDRLGIPSRERIEKLNREIDALTKKIDQQLAKPAVELPIANYEVLNVKDVVSHLDNLSPAELATIKEYEMAHENRVTVLREIDRRLEAEPVA
jgi:poly(hydroxyalkanoate) granule-associated protein